MSKRSTDELFQLLKSLEKAEKRNFKLYVRRNSGSTDLKIIRLFDALDKMEDYDEELLLRKHKSIQKQQLPNGLSDEQLELTTQTILLATRVSDDEVRQLVDEFRVWLNLVFQTSGEAESGLRVYHGRHRVWAGPHLGVSREVLAGL